jgi:hypothetical protein
MNLFQVVSALYTSKSPEWIKDLDRKDAEPFIVLKFLAMNDKLGEHVKYLNRYVFSLPWDMWLILAWATIPKSDKSPFVKFLKTESVDDLYAPVISKLQELLRLSDNDISHATKYLILEIEKDKPKWFAKLGMDKSVWESHGLDFNSLKDSATIKGKSGLDMWF